MIFQSHSFHTHSCQIHSLIKKAVKPPHTIILYVHGTYATSDGFIEPMKTIHQIDPCIEIHALDLVGFGVSHITDKNEKKQVASLSCDEIVSLYSKYIKSYIDKCIGKRKIMLIGHSFGGFLTIHFAHAFPAYVDKLVLINPCGIFPMLGKYGNYWALFFKSNILYFLYRIIHYIGVLKFFPPHNIAHILCKKDNFGFSFVSRFIYCGLGVCQWKHACIDKVLHLYNETNICINFIYGENDFIIPWHQGKHLCHVCKDAHFFLIPQAYHIPYLENLNAFCESIYYILHTKKRTHVVKNNMRGSLVKYVLEKHCFGSFFPSVTEKIIRYQYDLFYMICSLTNYFQ